MRSLFNGLLFAVLTGVVLITASGCSSNSEELVTDEQIRDVEREIDHEVDRVEDRFEEVRERLEERLDRHLTDEEIDRLTREIGATVENGLAKVGETLEKIGARLKEDSNVEVVDYRDFKELLPNTIQGLRLVDVSGSNKSGLGIRFSKIEAEYENEDENISMEMTIFDLGTMKGLTSMGFDWMDRHIDEEDIDGFKRTTKFGGYPGFESAEYNGSMVKAQGAAVVEDRFVVAMNIRGRDLQKELLVNVFEDFPFRDLRRLAN